jgi:hypothetical protein
MGWLLLFFSYPSSLDSTLSINLLLAHLGCYVPETPTGQFVAQHPFPPRSQSHQQQITLLCT